MGVPIAEVHGIQTSPAAPNRWGFQSTNRAGASIDRSMTQRTAKPSQSPRAQHAKHKAQSTALHRIASAGGKAALAALAAFASVWSPEPASRGIMRACFLRRCRCTATPSDSSLLRLDHTPRLDSTTRRVHARPATALPAACRWDWLEALASLAGRGGEMKRVPNRSRRRGGSLSSQWGLDRRLGPGSLRLSH